MLHSDHCIKRAYCLSYYEVKISVLLSLVWPQFGDETSARITVGLMGVATGGPRTPNLKFKKNK